MFNKLKNINSVRHMFNTGNHIYFSCLYPKYDWFDKGFSINKIIVPLKVKILNQTIFPDIITKEDRVFLFNRGFNDVIRKYKNHVYLDNGEKFTIDIFEFSHKTIVTVTDKYVNVGESKNSVEIDFYKSIIQLKLDLEFDKETEITFDDNFETFKLLYGQAIEMYPEEVIKIHSKQKKRIF